MRLTHACMAALFLCSSAAGWALANFVEEYSLEKKVQLSDIVVIGKAVSTNNRVSADTLFEYSVVRVEKVLKGDPPESFDFLSRSGISELDPNCCETGNVYLFFLQRLKNGKYWSVNGPYGVYLIGER
ncbi:MAG: hypothetical protein ACLPX9_21905 [Rhodomicrobium sp.]